MGADRIFTHIYFDQNRRRTCFLRVDNGSPNPSLNFERESMMQRSICLLVLAGLFLGGHRSNAEELRTWTDSSGKHEIRAEFIRFKGDKVTLQKEDGKKITLALSKLSDDDQEFVRDLSAPAPTRTPKRRPRSNNVVNSVRGAVYRSQTRNTMRQIGLAIINYQSARNRFPAAAIMTADKKPGLSWRVAILPYIEEKALYDRFRRDEAWDSEHNKKLITLMPRVLRSPGTEAEPGYTNYLALRLPNSVIAEGRRGVRIQDIRDGTSSTVMFVEADDDHAVIWTKPDDLEWSIDAPTAGLGNIWSGQFFVGFADGRVADLPNSTPANDLKALFTRDGGERVRLDSF